MLRPKPELYGIILFSYVGNVPGHDVRIPTYQPVQWNAIKVWFTLLRLRFVVFG